MTRYILDVVVKPSSVLFPVRAAVLFFGKKKIGKNCYILYLKGDELICDITWILDFEPGCRSIN